MLESSFHDPLSAQINAKTRSHHTILNRLITSRLQLCLPPNTSGPEIYAGGIAQFAQIFLAFEEVWDELIGVDGDYKGLEETWEALDEQYPNGSAAGLLSYLRTLRPHGLARTQRLHTDLTYFQDMERANEVLNGLKKSKAVEEFVAHIRHEVHANPHLLVAYAWTLYMAIFSGGRWIRAQLHGAGKDFWAASSTAELVKPDDNEKPTLEELREVESLGLGLWFFDGDQDGEDIKAEFKRRLNDGEHILTPTQRDDIMLESQDIFDRFKAMVDDLDAAFLATCFDHAPVDRPIAKVPTLGKKASKYLSEMPGYAGLALIISGISWYAVYHAGTWS
ncbi:heme oxygenase-like protein [Venturia nashicola]|nr:heme oxygenase-like protein [Venturia nashicola]